MIIKQHPIDELATPGAIFVPKIYHPPSQAMVTFENMRLIYFGNKNGGRRGQFVDRVLFNDHELTVDGPTGSNTQGYHPNPSAPIFGDIFTSADKEDLKAKWDLKAGNWQIKNDELKQS